MKRIIQSRFLLSLIGIVILAAITFFAIKKSMEGVAAAATGGVITIVTGYQISQGYTKGKYITTNTKDTVEG